MVAGEIDDHWPQRTEWPAQPQPQREETIYTTPGTEEFYAAHADPDQR